MFYLGLSNSAKNKGEIVLLVRRFREEIEFRDLYYSFLLEYLYKDPYLQEEKISAVIRDGTVKIHMDIKPIVDIAFIVVRDPTVGDFLCFSMLYMKYYYTFRETVESSTGFVFRGLTEGDRHYAIRFLDILAYKTISLVKKLVRESKHNNAIEPPLDKLVEASKEYFFRKYSYCFK